MFIQRLNNSFLLIIFKYESFIKEKGTYSLMRSKMKSASDLLTYFPPHLTRITVLFTILHNLGIATVTWSDRTLFQVENVYMM